MRSIGVRYLVGVRLRTDGGDVVNAEGHGHIEC